MRTDKVVVEDYNPYWHDEYIKIKKELEDLLLPEIITIEHVGSTSVEGLSAKAIIDLDIVIKDYTNFETVKNKLFQAGYFYEGDLGIKDKHAFKYSNKPHLMRHYLYVCPEYSEELKRHIAFRDYLRSNGKDRDWYGISKKLIAKYYPFDIESYMKAKAPIVAEIQKRVFQY